MQFPHDTNRHNLKTRGIPTIKLQHLKFIHRNCMRNFWRPRDPEALWRGLTTTNRGELHDTSLRHAGDTPQEGVV